MNGPEIVQFSQAVYGSCTDPNRLIEILNSLNQRFLDYAILNYTYKDQVPLVVAAANSEGWIAELVTAVVKKYPNNGQVRAFLVQNPHWDPSLISLPVHPCDALFIHGGRCFIGRSGLRRYLKAMEAATGKKVLVVTSSLRKVGKSYTKELIDFLTYNRPHCGIISVDFDRDDHNSGTLTKTIASRIGLELTNFPLDTQQTARWNQELVDWLIPQTPPTTNDVWWIVFDGFRQKSPSEGTRDFIDQLAQRIQGTTNFRLILINYTYGMPLAVKAFALKEEVSPLNRSEVEGFLSHIHACRHGEPPDPTKLSEYVTVVYERVGQYAAEYPESADDQLLLNIAASEAAELIQA